MVTILDSKTTYKNVHLNGSKTNNRSCVELERQNCHIQYYSVLHPESGVNRFEL